MHVSSLTVDLNWLLQFVFTALVLALGLRHILKNTASKYFVVDANSDPIVSSSSSSSSSSSCFSSSSSQTSSGDSLMPGVLVKGGCAICGSRASKQCSGCKAVKYCSHSCQSIHWRNGHKINCKAFGRGITLVPGGSIQKQVDKILFPYDEFVKLFNWDKPELRPCGLINCGNSCFANVVLQCLAHTRPLVAYLMDKDHRRECRRNEWCFLCELQCHLERASHQQPFSPLTILSHLPNIGGNLGYGKQEDAHEFMRFAIDTMQSICLDVHGGEKLIHPKSQETTLIQHIFGGQLQSQVICTQCNQVSNQYENMMDLTVEIQGDAASLEECLDQFTVKEWLHGDNMYKCDGCNDYVKAWKRLTIRQAPNILTIALKRFQSGRFGKLNKKIIFPENLNLSPYMSEEGDHTDKYKLYAVVVHVDMLNASFFGHYICYIKDFQGTWYRIDDCKVVAVELDDVLSQGAYMLLYSRISARATCLKTFNGLKKQEELDKSALEPEKHCLRTHSNSPDAEQTNGSTCAGSVVGELELCSNIYVPTEDPTSLPVSRDDQDHRDHIYSLATSAPVPHTHIETSSFISSPSEAHTISSESFTKGLQGSCSQGNAPFSTSTNSLASDDTSSAMQQFRNRIQFLEPGHSSENNLPTSSLTKSSAAEEDESPPTRNVASEVNENCNIFAGLDPPYKSVVAQHFESEICKNKTEVGVEISDPVILDQRAPNNDSRESERFHSNEDCKVFAGLDPPNKSVAQQSESEICQNKTEYDVAISGPIILNQIAPENNSRESERSLSDMDVDEVEINNSYNLANGNHIPDQREYSFSINNGLDEPSSSHQELSLTFKDDMEIDDNEVNENSSSNVDDGGHHSQGSVVNGGSFYATSKQLISKTHSPGVMESGAAH